MRVGFLTNNARWLGLADWLAAEGEDVIVRGDPLTAQEVVDMGIDFLVSYGFAHIIRAETIAACAGRAINLHISLLPWNRGSDPNIWSFLDETPKGVTIHLIDAGVDTGPVLLQRPADFDPATASFTDTYDTLHAMVQRLLKENWRALRAGAIVPRPQSGSGTVHLRRELDPLRDHIPLDVPIAEALAPVRDLVQRRPAT